MNSAEIRASFINFFKEKEHTFIRSSSVVPIDDPTLLFTNAGMNQFKPIFLDKIKPNNLRAVNTQKCIRVSGKHNDLEEVGVDKFHHTFFEMLGNWSFGDYYKEEAIRWAWELFTEIWKLDKKRLWVTVFKDDDVAYDLWIKVTDIDPGRVIRCGKKDNFWEMGETGPCGPCSEIHYFIGEDINQQDAKGVNNSDQYWELWNLVFIQNNRKSDGSLEDLPSKHVDTGAGLERIAAVMQAKTSNYDTDLFLPIIEELEKLTEIEYNLTPIPFRVIADHVRMLGFSIADGALPSNEGRGYVLRRILRRAARFGRELNLHEPFLYKLIDSLGNIMKEFFPEINEKSSHIKNVLESEEISFNRTLDRGLNHFEKIVDQLVGKTINGLDAFKLYDTYGFPLDLTQLMAKERGLEVDEDGFKISMDEQKNRARKKDQFQKDDDLLEWTILSEMTDSKFLGYDVLSSESNIIRYAYQDNYKLLVLDQTPFYAESGGQIGDNGTIKGEGVDLKVLDVKIVNDSFVHICEGMLGQGSKVLCDVDSPRRQSIRNNHTATHLMHKALKIVLGDHVNQAGSLVHPDYLRFDLTHFQKISNDQIVEVENLVNRQILINRKLKTSVKLYDEARKQGAEALFGEKYGDKVRVVEIGDYSMELCGGTHVDRTGDIGSFKIIEESSLSSGVRRIVAVTGDRSIREMQNHANTIERLQGILKTPSENIIERVEILLDEKKALEKKIKNRKTNTDLHDDILENVENVGLYQLCIKKIQADSIDDLKLIGDKIFEKLNSGICALFSEGEEKPLVVIIVSKDLNDKGILAGNLAKSIGEFMSGGGGGKPHLATAGGQSNNMLDDAIKKTKPFLLEQLKN